MTCICDEVTYEVVRGESWEIGEEVIMEAENRRQEKLEKLEKQFLMKRRRKYWNRLEKRKLFRESFVCCMFCSRWRHGFQTRRHARECVAAIPSLPPLLPLSAQLSFQQSWGQGERGSLDDGEIKELLEKEHRELDEKRLKL